MDFIFDSEILNRRWVFQARDLEQAWQKLSESETVSQDLATFSYDKDLSDKYNRGEIRLADVLQIP